MNTPDMQAAVAAAMAVVPKSTVAEAQALIADGALLVDVREAEELASSGKAKGALHVPRGMVASAAEVGGSDHDPAFRKDRVVLLYCGSGARAALAGQGLLEMGYADVRNVGVLKDWVEAGGEIEPA